MKRSLETDSARSTTITGGSASATSRDDSASGLRIPAITCSRASLSASETPKGSISVDGVSLTVAEVVRDRFSVALVPSTLERTTLGALEAGQRVNLETDLIAAYVLGTASTPAAQFLG